MKILIGCPAYQRSWILPYWFEAIENQTIPLSDIGFVFELGPNDDETHSVLYDWANSHREVAFFDAVIREDLNHYTHQDGHRTWTKNSYYKMVDLRNSLLDTALRVKPDKYFSLDSDILIDNPHTLEKLYFNLERDGIDAISPLSYMYPKGCDFPSVMTWANHVGGKASRQLDSYPMGKIFKSDIIMAAVMMNPEVYSNARYIWHPQGEDLGWSAECARAGYNLYCASDLYASHIMHRWMLDQHLSGGDPRNHSVLE